MIDAGAYPQLAFLLWGREGRLVTEEEALSLYEANRQWIDPASMEPAERAFLERIVMLHGRGIFLG